MIPEKKRDTMLGALRAGAPRDEAAGFAGVNVMVLEDTLRAGRADPESAEGKFRVEFLKAEEGAKVFASKTVMDAAREGDWKAAAFWLERRAPENWTKGGKVDMTQFIRIDELVRIMTKLGKVLNEVIPDEHNREKVAETLSNILQEATRAA